MKPITTTAHGVLDYLTAGTLLTLPRAMGWSNKVTAVMAGAGLGTLTYSLLTRYELGLKKILPMKLHLSLDAVSGALFLGSPFLFQDEDMTVKGILAGIGLFELTTALLTQTQPSEQEQIQEAQAELKNTIQDVLDNLETERTDLAAV